MEVTVSDAQMHSFIWTGTFNPARRQRQRPENIIPPMAWFADLHISTSENTSSTNCCKFILHYLCPYDYSEVKRVGVNTNGQQSSYGSKRHQRFWVRTNETRGKFSQPFLLQLRFNGLTVTQESKCSLTWLMGFRKRATQTKWTKNYFLKK